MYLCLWLSTSPWDLRAGTVFFFPYNLITWQSRNPVFSYSTVKHRKWYSIFCNNGRDSEKLSICPYIYMCVCVCVCVCVCICDIHWKLTECCKSTIIQLQNKKGKDKESVEEPMPPLRRTSCIHKNKCFIYLPIYVFSTYPPWQVMYLARRVKRMSNTWCLIWRISPSYGEVHVWLSYFSDSKALLIITCAIMFCAIETYKIMPMQSWHIAVM